MGFTPIDNLDQYNQVINAERPVIVHFFTSAEGPGAMLPYLEAAISQTASGDLTIYVIDIDSLEVDRGFPTVPFTGLFHGGQMIDGALPSEQPKASGFVEMLAGEQ